MRTCKREPSLIGPKFEQLDHLAFGAAFGERITCISVHFFNSNNGDEELVVEKCGLPPLPPVEGV